MKKPLAIALFALLAGCVTPPPITNKNDAFAEAYATVSTLTSLVASGERNGVVQHTDAIALYKRIREANDDIYTAQSMSSSTDGQTSLQAAQAILKDVQMILISKGVSHE